MLQSGLFQSFPRFAAIAGMYIQLFKHLICKVLLDKLLSLVCKYLFIAHFKQFVVLRFAVAPVGIGPEHSTI